MHVVWHSVTLALPCCQPGHRVPRFSEAHLGLCIPSSCTPAEAQVALEWVLNARLQDQSPGQGPVQASGPQGIAFKASVIPQMCRAHDHAEPPNSTAAHLAR